MKTTCKPCITIRTFFFLLRKNYQQFRKDLRDYSNVQYYACEMPKYKAPKTIDEGMAEVRRVREIAKRLHDKEKAEEVLKCYCYNCSDNNTRMTRMILCPECGNKRCPRATDHTNACTNSNEPGQEGSRY